MGLHLINDVICGKHPFFYHFWTFFINIVYLVTLTLNVGQSVNSFPFSVCLVFSWTLKYLKFLIREGIRHGSFFLLLLAQGTFSSGFRTQGLVVLSHPSSSSLLLCISFEVFPFFVHIRSKLVFASALSCLGYGLALACRLHLRWQKDSRCYLIRIILGFYLRTLPHQSLLPA